MAKKSITDYPNAPDIESSSLDYATRFTGDIGQWFLETQKRATKGMIKGDKLRVLDVGGGHGQNIDLFNSLGHDLTVIGSNSQCTAVIFEDIEKGTVRFDTGYLLNLPYPENSFDVVISYRTFSHMENWGAFVNELCRVAKTTVIIDYPAKLSINVLSNLFFFLKKGIEKNTRKYLCFTEKEVNAAFKENGFVSVSTYKQYLIPMAIHRALGMKNVSQISEDFFRKLRFTKFLGSPVITRFECRSSTETKSEPERDENTQMNSHH